VTFTLLEFDPEAVGVHPSAEVEELQAASEKARAAMARTDSVFCTEFVFFTGQVWGQTP
jgi:hypothetical protein